MFASARQSEPLTANYPPIVHGSATINPRSVKLFEQPFPGSRAKDLGIRNNFTSPGKVPEAAFAEIYRHGIKLPAPT